MGADPDKDSGWGSGLADIPGGMGKLEAEEAIAVADGGEGGDNAEAEAAEDNGAGSVVAAMDLTDRESDAEDVGEIVGGDKEIEHLKEVHTDQPGRELVDKAIDLLVLVMTGEDNHLAIHEAGSRDVKELAGCTDSSADEEREDTRVDLTGLKHVRGEERDSGVEVDLVEEIGRRMELVENNELLGWDEVRAEDDSVRIEVPWLPVDA